MESVGIALVMGGLLSIVFPALKHARSMNRFTSYLRSEHPDIWLKLGKPEISILYPFRALPAFNAVEKNIPEFDAFPKLRELQHKAKFWFYAYGANFGIIFLGFLLVALSNAL